MSEKELGEALNAIYDLEKERYQTMRLSEGIVAEIKSCGIPKKIEPVPAFESERMIGNLYGKAFGILGAVVGVISYYMFIKALDEPNLPAIVTLLLTFAGWALWTGLCFFAMACIGKRIDAYCFDRALKKEHRAWEEKVAPQVEAYQTAVAEDQARIYHEKIKALGLNKEQWSLRELEEKETASLEELYEKSGIGTDYQKLIPMRYMANFFNLGISRKLEGTDGLYYLVRQELRADQFNASLQEISQKMDTIISKQSEIYRELLSIEEQNREIMRELDNGFSAVASSVSAAAKEAQKGMESSVSRYIGSCQERQNRYLYLASQWGR